MPEAGAVLKFPGGKPPKKAETLKSAPSLPAMDSYEYEDTVELHTIALSVKRKGEEIISLIDEDRDAARRVGIEVLGVQIRSILEGEKLTRVIDALEDAIYRKVPCSLTREGVDKVHRLERLVSDADSIVVQRMSGRRGDLGKSLKAVYSERSSIDNSIWIPLVIVGIAGIVGVIAILAFAQPRPTNPSGPLGQSAQPIQSTTLSKSKKSKQVAQSR